MNQAPFVRKQPEAVPLELVVVAIQIVAAELIDDHNHDQLGTANVGLGWRRGRQSKGQQNRDEGGEKGIEETRP